ncbi:LuxR C-terminal-related transcriptional regulator [Kitasatospora sp. SUK 42]|uniref:LuxR C-terminal-related transcriptional regulator n=1 Tax=Kitasatospora sp. SUK 42 TaxID=1588882 RepID=UPI0018C8E6FD|nr:LuxR C-terminal-related transcriptional regulator [Kitasatospora sp. SUK 42]
MAFFIDDELLRLGLQGLARNLAGEIEAVFVAREANLNGTLAGRAPQVVVVTAASSAKPPMGDVPAEHPPRRLMILDRGQVTDVSDLANYTADGYLIRQNLTADALGRALRQLTAGEMVIPVELGREMVRRVSGAAPRNRSATLTIRESETLSLLVRGMSNKQIGRRLSISEHGAKRLVSSVLLKLNATNRTSAVVNAIRSGLVDEADMDIDIH